MQIWNPAASVTRPNDTTAYAVGDLVANSTTAGSVVPLSFPLGNSYGIGQFRINRARLAKSGTGVTNATFRVHLYAASPSPANGDNGAWSTDQAGKWLGNIDVTSMLAFTDGAAGTGSLPAGSEGLTDRGARGVHAGGAGGAHPHARGFGVVLMARAVARIEPQARLRASATRYGEMRGPGCRATRSIRATD